MDGYDREPSSSPWESIADSKRRPRIRDKERATGLTHSQRTIFRGIGAVMLAGALVVSIGYIAFMLFLAFVFLQGPPMAGK